MTDVFCEFCGAEAVGTLNVETPGAGLDGIGPNVCEECGQRALRAMAKSRSVYSGPVRLLDQSDAIVITDLHGNEIAREPK